MIGLAISFIIIGFIYSVYRISIRISESWKEKMDRENTAMICLHRLTEDLIHASTIEWMGKDKLVLRLIDDKQIVYECQDYNLYRNGFCVNPHKVDVYGLSFRYLKSDEISEASEEIFNDASSEDALQEETTRKNPVIGIKMILGSPKKQVTITSAVHPRNVDKAVFETL